MKFLTPILGVGAVAATIIPLSVSCGKSANTLDGNSLYIPTTDKAVTDEAHKETGYTNEEANDLYFGNVDKNGQVFIDDIMFFYSAMMYAFNNGEQVTSVSQDIVRSSTTINGNLTLNYKDITVAKKEIESTDDHYYTMSFKLTGSCNFDMYVKALIDNNQRSKIPTGGGKFCLNSFEFTIEDVPFTVRYLDQWLVGPADFIFANNETDVPNFKVTLKADGYIASLDSREHLSLHKYNNKQIVINQDNYSELYNKGGDEAVLLTTAMAFSSTDYSYHLSDIDYNSSQEN